jgi:hypothetical protein
MRCDITEQKEVKGYKYQRLDWHIGKLRRRGAEVHVLYCDGILKWLPVRKVLAEMLSCKLLYTVNRICWHKAFLLYFTLCDGIQQCLSMAEHLPEFFVMKRNWIPLPGSWISATQILKKLLKGSVVLQVSAGGLTN